MRQYVLPIVTLAVLSQVAFAQTTPTFPVGSLETEARLLGRVSPETKTWIRQEAAREMAANTISQQEVTRAAAAYRNALGQNTGDIEALAFLVLMQASKSAQEDVKAMAADVKRINDVKSSMRHRARTKEGSSVSRPPGTTSVAAVTRPPTRTMQAMGTLTPLSKAEFDRRLELAKSDLDSMGEMSEMESLRLQMAMDRMSKMMSTLSNLLKKISDTSSGITQNLK